MEEQPLENSNIPSSTGPTITPSGVANDRVIVNDSSQSDNQNGVSISSPVWFFYPQTGAINFNRHFYVGSIQIANDRLSISSNNDGQMASYAINDISEVKRWAPVMTFFFNDGTKFQIDFHNVRQNVFAIIPLIGPLISLSSKNYKEGLINMKQFEDYFTQLGLIK